MSAGTIADIGEIEMVARILEVLGARAGLGDGKVRVGPGDDAAVLAAGEDVVLTTDSQHEDVHFRRAWIEPHILGRRAIAVNASDLGAMGARPTGFLAALALPPDTAVDWALGIAEGLRDGARRWGAEVIGGDVAAIEGGVVINVTGVGERAADARAGRDGARTGQHVVVTGRPGRAGVGRWLLQEGRETSGEEAQDCVRAFLQPEPPVELGVAAVRAGLVSAMMDVSDGIGVDLGRLCRTSGVGARLDAGALFDDALLAAVAKEHGLVLEDCVLGGGEDYELLCVVESFATNELLRLAAAHQVEARHIGVIVDAAESMTLADDGEARPLRSSGWDHFS